MSRPLPLALLLASFALACTSNLDLPSDITITCASDAQCPDGLHCVAQLCAPESSPCVTEQGGVFVAANNGNKCALGGVDGVCISGQCTSGICGDGYVAGGEACDDGNAQSGDGCRGDCLKLETCGDGSVDAGEACDDSNTASGDGCRGDCKKNEVCGDAVVDDNEVCDDANQNPNDGCDACATTTWLASQLIGNGTSGGNGAEYSFDLPNSVAVDNAGNAYVSAGQHVLRIDAATQRVTVIAGNGVFGYSGDGGPAPLAQLWAPAGLAVDSRGFVYISDQGNRRIRRVDPTTSIITTIVGNGADCSPSTAPCGDGGPAIGAQIANPIGLAIGEGGLFIADQQGRRIRRYDLTNGTITTAAGTGASCSGVCGDGGPATAAGLGLPRAVAVGGGKLYIADWASTKVRVVDLTLATPTIATFAGTGVACPSQTAACGDGGPAASATFMNPSALALDGSGGLLVSEGYLYGPGVGTERIRRIDVQSGTHLITTIAGSGLTCPSAATPCGDGGPATGATFASPGGLAVSVTSILVLDQNDNRVRRIDRATNVITAFAGSGRRGDTGDRGAATAGDVQSPRGVAVDNAGNVFVADQAGFTVRRVDGATGVISTVVGTGTQCNSNPCNADGIQAASAVLKGPAAVTIDATGTLYVGDLVDRRIYRVDAAGTLSLLAGTGVFCASGTTDCGDGGPATAADLGQPIGLTVHDNALWVADGGSARVRRIDLAATPPTITTAVGDGNQCSTPTCGVGGAPTAAQLFFADALAFDAAGNLYVADGGAHRVYKVSYADPSVVITRFAGTGTTCSGSCDGGGDPLAASIDARGMTIDALGDMYISDYVPGRITRVHYDPVATAYVLATVAGNGSGTHTGDGGAPLAASLNQDEGLASHGTKLYVAENDSNARVRVIDFATNRVTTLVGVDPLGDGPLPRSRLTNPTALTSFGVADQWIYADGTSQRLRRSNAVTNTLDSIAGYPDGNAIAGTPGAARFSALLEQPAGVAYDGRAGHHEVYVSERQSHTIIRLSLVDPSDSATWTIASFAGERGNPGGPGALTEALPSRFDSPTGLAFAANTGLLYVADTGNHVIRAIDVDAGTTRVVAGTVGVPAFIGERVAATEALLDGPRAVALAPAGSPQETLFIADTGNHRVRAIDLASGEIDTVVGDGTAASGGVGAPARVFPVDTPSGVAVDSFGNLFVTSRNTVRLVAATGAMAANGNDTVATIYGSPPRTTLPQSITQCLSGIAVSSDEQSVVILDACLGAAIEVRRQRDALP